MTGSRLLGTEFKVFGSLDTQLLLGFTLFALESQYNFTRRLGLFVKDGFGLTTESHLFTVVPAFALRKVTRLAGLVLRHLVQFMLFALLARAVRSALFRDIDHDWLW